MHGNSGSTAIQAPESPGQVLRLTRREEVAPAAAGDEIAALRAIVEGTARSTGEVFFQSLVRHLATAIGVSYAFVAEFAGRRDAGPDPRLLGKGADSRERRVRPGRDPLRGRRARGAVPPSPRGPGEVPARPGAGRPGDRELPRACRCSTARGRCSATWRCSTSGPCRPSRGGCSSSGSSPPAPPSSSSGCGSRSSSWRASGATGTSTRRRRTPTCRSAETGGLISVNRRATQLLGYSAEELVGSPVLELFAETPSGRARAEQAIRTGVRRRGGLRAGAGDAPPGRQPALGQPVDAADARDRRDESGRPFDLGRHHRPRARRGRTRPAPAAEPLPPGRDQVGPQLRGDRRPQPRAAGRARQGRAGSPPPTPPC